MASPGEEGVHILHITEPEQHEVLRRPLEREGVVFEAAFTVDDARRKLDPQKNDRPPDMIFLNLDVGRTEALRLLQEVKATTSPYRDIPVMVFSAYTGEEALQRLCEGLGATYLEMPLELADVLANVQSLRGEA